MKTRTLALNHNCLLMAVLLMAVLIMVGCATNPNKMKPTWKPENPGTAVVTEKDEVRIRTEDPDKAEEYLAKAKKFLTTNAAIADHWLTKACVADPELLKRDDVQAMTKTLARLNAPR